MNQIELKAFMERYDLDKHVLAMIAGVSRRTVENWLQGRPISKPPLLLISQYQKNRKR